MKTRERAAAPLLEMIISITVLAFAGVVALGVFLSARFTQTMSQDKVNAMYKVQNAIELVKADDEITELSAFYDEKWQECDELTAVFDLRVSGESSDGLFNGKAECRRIEKYPFIRDNDGSLCTIEFAARRAS